MGLRVLASMISAPGGRSLGRAGTLAFVALAVAACGGQPGLPELPAMPDFFGDKTSVNAADDPPERLYNEGLYLLNNKRDPKAAAKKFEEVDRQHPYSEWARKSLIMSAYAYYDGREYEEAIGAAKRYVTLHPGTSDAAYAQFLIGSSYFDQIPDITRDQAGTEKAVNALEEVARKFPNSEYASSAKKKLEIARDQLAGKEMTTGRYYQEKRDYTAAINRFKVVVTHYQTTRHVEEALMRLTETYMSLGIVGEAQTAAAVLGHNFPDSPWYKDAYSLVKSGGLEPREDAGSWISKAFKKIGLGDAGSAVHS
ncbi:MAG: outer membrane protein assembly factor BamD [Xanthobacteraceae bacterium]|jgi:outer membrane protein assembly factor BamD